MSNEISTSKLFITSKSTESRWLVISSLPETATEETIKECFARHGRVQSVKIDDQRFALVTFLDILTASKAHQAENILDKQQLQTAFYDGSNFILQVFLETSPVTSSIIEPPSSSPSSITTVTNTIMDKTITAIHEDRDKRTSRTPYSPEENTRHQVVPMKHDSDSSGSKRKTSSINNSKITKMKSTRRKDDNSSSSSERSHSSSKHRHQHTSKSKRQSPNLNHLKTKILKIYHLPSKISTQSLRETLRNIFIDFKKPSHLLSIKIINDHALLTFQKSEDVEKALLFIITKSINGIRLKAEPYDDLITENDEYNLMKRCSDLDIDEYSVKATRTLYIGNLQPEISYQELRDTYSIHGEIIEIEIKRQQPQHSQIFAFIQYADIKSVVKAFKSKIIQDHSIKLGFGKSQPTNVLWLDNLPLNITELMLRAFLNRITNLSSEEILDIYIDDRNSQKTLIVQGLIYFTDTIAAQNAINSIRGRKIETKRIQVDFASRIFLTRFSDIIQQINEKKNNNRWTNQSYRRYSKESDTNSSVIQNPTCHHSSSSSSNHSSINHKKLIPTDTNTHANTERIFDWLMQNHHSNVNNHEEESSEEQISNIKIIENQKNSKEISKKIFQTKLIPLESNSLFIQSDIRLKVYSSLFNQSIESIHLPFPKFAKNLITKSSNHSIILNPKAHLKHLLNNISTKQESINQDFLINQEIDERIRLLDKQIQISTTVLSHSANFPSTISTAAIKFNPIPTTTTFHSSIPTSLMSPPISNDKSNNNFSNISSTELLERLNPTMKFQRKPIPPPLSVITTLPAASNNNDSPIFPTPKSLTPSSTIGKQNHSPALTNSPASQKQIATFPPKPTVLKSILKHPSNLSQSISNEIRKTVHIVSTNLSLESTIKRTLPSDNQTKPDNQQKNHMNKQQTGTKKSSYSKLIETTKKPLKIIKKPLLSTKATQSRSKTSHQLNQKTTIKRPEINKKSLSIKPIPQNQKLLLKNESSKPKPQPLLNKPSVSTVKKPGQQLLHHNNKILKKSTNEILKKKLKIKESTCMYDRIKERQRNEHIRNSLLPTIDKNSDDHTPSKHIQQLKRHNVIMDSAESEDDKSIKMKNSTVFDRNIFDTEENDSIKTHQQSTVTFKFMKKEFILKKKLKTKFRPQKRPLIDEENKSSKKIKLQSKIQEEQIIKSEISFNDTVIGNTISPKTETASTNHHDNILSSNTTSKRDGEQVILMTCKEEPTLQINEAMELVDVKPFEPIKPISSPSIHQTQQDTFNKEHISNALTSQILTDKSTSQSTIDESSEKTLIIANHFPISNTNPSNLPIDHPAVITDKSIPSLLSDITKPSCFPSSATNELLNPFDARPITTHKHPSTPLHPFPQTLTPDSNLFTPHQQHFPYPLFVLPPPDSPPLSTRTLSTSSCSSVIGNPYYNTIIPGQQQHFHDKESRRESFSKFPTTSSQYLASDSITSLRNPSELYDYPTAAQQMLSSFATEFYRMNDIQSSDPYDIQWDGYIILKTEQAYIKTQLIAGNSQIARITINYWNANLHHNLRISQRMRLEEIQLDGVKKHMQMDNDYCILIAEANGLTPEEIRLEQNHLKTGVIQYLNEKKAAGIINILLPGVLQPVYVVHIFPPCQFASEILQKHAPDAYRCVVQNKIEQIYLLFIITSTIQ